MAFEEKLPEWNAVGIEPPQSLKDSGYKFNDEPAPDHFNYMFNRAYKVMQELQQESASTTDVGAVATTLKTVTDRIDKVSNSALVLAQGLQTITSDRDKPYNLNFIRARMLLNLIGKLGNFDVVTGWSFSNVTPSSNATNALYGSNALQLALTSTSGRMSRTLTTTVGKSYLIAVDVKVGTATNAKIDVTGITGGNTVTSTANYQLSYMAFTATATSHSIGVTVTGANGQTVFVDGYRVYEIGATDFGNVSNLTSATASSYYPYTEGLAGVKNPYAIRWAESSRVNIISMMAFDTELLASPGAEQDTDREILSVNPDGQYVKSSMWRKMTLGGELPWVFKSSSTGFKRVQISALANGISTTPQGFLTKYDAQITRNDLGTIANWTTGDIWQLGDGLYNNFYLSISVADSGWGDSYTPTSDEIKAYFYGYKMYDSGTLTASQAQTSTSATYNGTGTKQWVNLIGTPVASALPITVAVGYTPYELMYRRTSTVSLPVPSEGAVSLKEGDNFIEVGSGIVLREVVRPQLSNIYYYINGSTTPASNTKNKVRSFLQVYRNGRVEKWSFLSTGSSSESLGLQQAQIISDQFSPDDTYSATYRLMESYPVASFVGNVQNNERSILNDLINDIDLLTRRLSVTEMRKSDKEGASNWIMPTFLSNWTVLGTENGYAKIPGLNMVYFRFSLTGGATAFATPLFVFASGYRPKRVLIVNCVFRDNAGNTVAAGAIQIDTSGRVVLSDGNFLNGALHFAGVFTLD